MRLQNLNFQTWRELRLKSFPLCGILYEVNQKVVRLPEGLRASLNSAKLLPKEAEW